VTVYSDVYRQHEMVTSFQQLLGNVFLPLFEATVNPQRHLNIHKFLQFVSTNSSPRNGDQFAATTTAVTL